MVLVFQKLRNVRCAWSRLNINATGFRKDVKPRLISETAMGVGENYAWVNWVHPYGPAINTSANAHSWLTRSNYTLQMSPTSAPNGNDTCRHAVCFPTRSTCNAAKHTPHARERCSCHSNTKQHDCGHFPDLWLT